MVNNQIIFNTISIHESSKWDVYKLSSLFAKVYITL